MSAWGYILKFFYSGGMCPVNFIFGFVRRSVILPSGVPCGTGLGGVSMTMKVIIIGAVALGSKAACRFKRLMPDARVTLIDSDEQISYGGCGIPYYVSGDVSDASELRSTSFHRVRDDVFFREDKGVDVMTGTTALSIDRDNKSVRVRMKTGEEKDLFYDKLVIATGARPKKLDIPGFDKKNVFAVGNLNDAVAIKQNLVSGKVEKAVIIGAGFIGLEMAEAISDMWEIETHVVEYFDQIMPGFVSKNFSIMARKVMEEKGVFFHLGESVREIKGGDAVSGVRTDNGVIEADIVISAVGIGPDSDLALRAGLTLSDYGHIVVNDRMQTSDPNIYSGGDCVTITNLVTGKPGYFPLGSLANRQGRVIGSNLAGKDAGFAGAVGSFTVKLFDYALLNMFCNHLNNIVNHSGIVSRSKLYISSISHSGLSAFYAILNKPYYMFTVFIISKIKPTNIC